MPDPISKDLQKLAKLGQNLDDFFARSGKGFRPVLGARPRPRTTSIWVVEPFEIDMETTAADREGFAKISLYFYGTKVGSLRLYGVRMDEVRREVETLKNMLLYPKPGGE